MDIEQRKRQRKRLLLKTHQQQLLQFPHVRRRSRRDKLMLLYVKTDKGGVSKGGKRRKRRFPVETTDQVFTMMGIYQSEWAHYDDIVWRHAFTHFGFILAFMLFPFVTTWVKQSGLASLPCFLYVFPCVGFVLAVILFFVMRSYSKRMRCSGDAYRKLIKMLPKDYQEKMLHDDIENTNRPTITIVVGVVMCVLLIAVALLIAFYLIPQWSTIAATAANKV